MGIEVFAYKQCITERGEDNDISLWDPVRGGTSIVKEFFKHALPRGVCRYPQAHARSVEGRARVGMRVKAARWLASSLLSGRETCWEIGYFRACKRLLLLLFPANTCLRPCNHSSSIRKINVYIRLSMRPVTFPRFKKKREKDGNARQEIKKRDKRSPRDDP